MWAQFRRFNSLPGAAKADFLRALLLLPLIRTSLRVRGFHPRDQRVVHLVGLLLGQRAVRHQAVDGVLESLWAIGGSGGWAH